MIRAFFIFAPMISFIAEILQKLHSNGKTLSDLTFVLPSKRAGSFLRKEISKLYDQPVFSPQIFSIEELSEKISGLETIDTTTTLFEFYSVYSKATPKQEVEDLENFSSWAQTLIQDFNEIDRYLVPPGSIFNYLAEIQDLNHWYLSPNKTELVENYLKFWHRLPEYYEELNLKLFRQGKGYQGMVYRKASENIKDFAGSGVSDFVFLGFNALNSAEQVIIQEMLQNGARIFWDIDEVHFNDEEHDVSLFMRSYRKNWSFYRDHDFEMVSENFNSVKEIEIIGVPKRIGQAKHVGKLLNDLNPREQNSTALVLGDEGLLLPVLNSMPNNIKDLNITMGFPLKYSPFGSLFEKLFEIFKLEKETFYYKDVISILSVPVVKNITGNNAEKAVNEIKKRNLLYLSKFQVLELFDEKDQKFLSLCFPEGKITPPIALENFKGMILEFRENLNKDKDPLNLEFLFHYNKIFNRLAELVNKYPHLKTVASLHHFYKELNNLQNLDFKGKPFTGLQLMGMLETRVLDFETVILTSVEEGTLPAGKTTNSFIPYELKKAYKLPTYKEKDAVYTYHFYHLLHRAKNVYLLHNTDTESKMGGEKSRFLLQLKMEKQPFHKINYSTITPHVPKINTSLRSVRKTSEILEKIRELASKGFSPSALTTYIRNPLDFYSRYILGIKDREEVEETVAYNTLGTVVHETLREFYTPLAGKELSAEHIEDFLLKIPGVVTKKFEEYYSKVPLIKGKNLLIFEVAKRYVSNFLKREKEDLQSGKKIVVREIETNLKNLFPIPEMDFPVYIKGNVDRVDECNGIYRIIDYKTGKVSQNQLEIVEWEDLITDYDKFSKPFQVLMYASMLLEGKEPTTPVEAGVISFKNLKEGFLKFTLKDKPGKNANKKTFIDKDIIEEFKEQLKNLILEICDPEIEFNEKVIKTYGNY